MTGSDIAQCIKSLHDENQRLRDARNALREFILCHIPDELWVCGVWTDRSVDYADWWITHELMHHSELTAEMLYDDPDKQKIWNDRIAKDHAEWQANTERMKQDAALTPEGAER